MQRALGNPAAEVLSLEYRGIEDLTPLMGALSAMPQLAMLSLDGNRLTSLPTDMSGLRKLQKLQLRHNMLHRGSCGESFSQSHVIPEQSTTLFLVSHQCPCCASWISPS